MKCYRNFVDPPVRIAGPSGASIYNDGFETYEEIVDENADEEGLASCNQVEQSNSEHPPTCVGIKADMRNANLSGKDQPPPLPSGRRPTAFDGARQRGKTEPCVEEIPLSTMPYGFSRARTSNPTSVNSEHFPSAYVNSTDINAGLSQLRNQNIPKQPVYSNSPPVIQEAEEGNTGEND